MKLITREATKKQPRKKRARENFLTFLLGIRGIVRRFALPTGLVGLPVTFSARYGCALVAARVDQRRLWLVILLLSHLPFVGEVCRNRHSAHLPLREIGISRTRPVKGSRRLRSGRSFEFPEPVYPRPTEITCLLCKSLSYSYLSKDNPRHILAEAVNVFLKTRQGSNQTDG